MSFSILGYNESNRYEFHQFMIDTQQYYTETKRHSGQLTERSRHILNDKFSSVFQNKYQELSARFDSVIDKAQIGFDDHRASLQDEQETFDQLMIHMSQTQQSQFTELISRLLINSEGIYQKWVKQEIVTLKEQLQMIVIKNCEMEVEITQSYEQFEMVKERLDEEMNYRFQLEKHLVSLEKQLVIVKEENYQLHSSNKSLLASKQHLDEQVQSTKIAQRDSSKSELIQKDRLNEEKQKTNQLEKENILLAQRIMELENQLQEFRTQQQNFIQEIKHLSEIVENQSYELEFYKNRDFRQSPSAILQSYDKLNKYQDLIESYKKTNEKESLRGFMLSHQKSMGKLSIFEPRQSEERLFEKLSNPDFSLRSFEIIQQSGMKRQEKQQNLNFPNFNQVTFRPEVDQFKSLLKEHPQSQSNGKCHVQFVIDCNLQTDEKKNMQIFREEYLEQPKQICIESLSISSQKHLIQRSQSISQLHSSVSKKLIYDQLNQDEIYNSKQLFGKQFHELQKEKSLCGYSDSHTKAHKLYLNSKFCNSRKQIETKTHIKKLSQDIKDNFDNRSETNSVNKALIKKNIKVQKEIDDFQQKLQSAEHKLESYQQTLRELQEQVKYYKNQLSKTAQITIRYKSEIQANTAEIQMLENYRLEATELISEKSEEIKKRQEQIELLNEKVHQLNSSINQQKDTFQERLLKVKQYCKTYIQEKHQTDIENLSYQYEQQIQELQQNLKIKSIKPLLIDAGSQTSKKSLSLSSSFHEKLYNLITKQSQSIQTDSLFQQIKSMQTDSIFPQQTQSKQTETIISQSSQSMQTHSIKPMLSFNSTVFLTIQPTIFINQLVSKRFAFSLVVSEVFQGSNQSKECKCALFSAFSQKIHLQKANSVQKFRTIRAFQFHLNETNLKNRRDLQKLSFIRVHPQNTYVKNRKQRLNFANVVSEKVHGNKENNRVNNITYHRVYSEFFNVQKNLQVNSRNFSLISCFSLLIQRPILMKSPFYQKKQLLNTPSSLDSLQTKKQTTGCSRPSKKYDSNQSFCRSQISQLHQESVDVEESFYTVQFHKDLQRHYQPDSFFTCIKFLNQTVRSEIQDYTDSKILHSQILDSQILKQEIFVAKKSIFVEQDYLASLETSEVLETLDQNIPQTLLLKDDFNVKTLEQFIEPKKIMEYREVPEIVRPRASSKHLKKSREPYFKVSLPEERIPAQEEKFYSNLFEKQLQTYFKKHTNFVFNPQLFPQGFIPNVEKMYLIHAQSNQNLDKKQLLPTNFPKRQTFLLYKRLLLNIESSKKLQIPKLSMFKFISDENKLVLGNFEIIINTDGELRITRKNKRCFYLGELDDGIWSMQKIEEINVICPPHKR